VRTRCGAARSFGFLVLVAVLALTGEARGDLEVYFSPDVSGSRPGKPLHLQAAGEHSIELFLRMGNELSGPGAVCDAGEGSEVCGWNLRLETEGQIRIRSFAATQDSFWSVQPTKFQINGGDPIGGTIGTSRVGRLRFTAEGPGSIRLSAGEYLDAALGRRALSSEVLVAVPEPRASTCAIVALCGLAWLRLRGGGAGPRRRPPNIAAPRYCLEHVG